MKKSIFLYILIFLSTNSFCKKNIVVIKGKKRDRIQSDAPTDSFTVRQDSIKSPSLKKQFEAKASLSTEESYQISGNDFIIPQIRGQRKENTELWLNEGLIYDPWMSMPISYSFNPKEFSSIRLYEGLTPFDIPSLNPFGVIQYKKISFKNQIRVGTKVGQPYGEGLWGLLERGKILESNLNLGLFFSLHGTEGSYSYYNNKGTPFNSKNSSFSSLKDNEQSSFLISPYFSFRYKKLAIKFHSFIYKEKRNSPTLDINKEKLLLSNLSLLNQMELRWKFDHSKSFAPKNLLLILNHQTGDSHSYSNNLKTKNKSDAIRLTLSQLWGQKYFDLKTSFRYAFSSINYTQKKKSYTSQRSYFDFYGAYTTKFSFPINFQNKYLLRFSTREINSSKKELSFNYAAIFFYKRHKKTFYFQFSKSKRLPNLLEELGDGYQISPSENLHAEENTHFELGAFLKGVNAFSGNVFCDFSYHKIALYHASFNKFKALNLEQSRTVGAEVSHTYQGNYFEIYSGLSLMQNLDTKNPRKSYIIPFSPFYVITNQVSWTFQDFFINTSSRLKGSYYDDIANTILVKPHLLSHLTIGYTYKVFTLPVSGKFSLNNLFDVKSLDIETTGKNKKFGKIPRNEFYGIPLPGRSWVLEFEVKF